MAETKPDSRQIKKRQALKNLGTPVDSTVETVLDKVNVEVDSPLRMSASATPDAILNFASSLIAAADTASKVVSPVKKQIFSGLTSPTINFQTQALSNAAHFDIAFPVSTVGQFRYVGFTLIGSGKIKALFSAEAATEGALTNPGALFVAGGLPIGYMAIQCTQASPSAFKTAGSATNIIENTKIFRFGSGAGGSGSSSSGSGVGTDLLDLRFRAELTDTFSDSPDASTPTDVGTNKTDPTLHDVANELFRFNYDASKTVTGTGTSMSLSAAPTFTVKLGDVLVVGNEVREITALGSINSTGAGFTITSAFSTNPAAAQATVSQAIYTKDLNSFDSNGTGIAVNSQISSALTNVLVVYNDTATLGDIIPDLSVTPHVAYHITADNSTWGDKKVRTTNLTDTAPVVAVPTTGTQFRIRFFANKTSGSGAVNLLDFKAYWHEQIAEVAGENYNTAFYRPTASTGVNATHGVVGGKSRFTFTFTYGRGLNTGNPAGSALEVYANGQLVPRFESGITNNAEAYFTEISDSVIEMDTDYSSAGIEFQFKVPRIIVDSRTQNTNRLSDLEAYMTDMSDLDRVSLPTVAAPNTTIVNRAQVVDMSADLSTVFGVNRIMTQSVYQIPNESGANGEQVFGVVNDQYNQIRFVGSWLEANSNYGKLICSTTIGDYAEITFFGTGLNILFTADTTVSRDLRVSVDGGAEGSNIVSSSYSNTIAQRNYAANVIIPVATGLAAGLHTVKLRAATAINGFYGFEVVNTSATLTHNPGSYFTKGKKITTGLQSTSSYNSGFESGTLGTRGGRVVVYQKADGTIGKAVTPVNAAQANLTSADHTNEEIIRTYNPREFGAGRADDFSLLINSSSNRAFVLDDNTTALSAYGGAIFNNGLGDGLGPVTANDYIIFTFTGTGLDIVNNRNATQTASFTITVDGTAIATGVSGATLFGNGLNNTVKIVSGLPYGTHTVRIVMTVAGNGLTVSQFKVYGPKKPTIPATATEIADYNVMANYVAATSGTWGIGANSVGTGIIRKHPTREMIYVGTWTSPAINTGIFESGFDIGTNTIGAYVEYTFWGTGAVLKNYFNTNTAANCTISIDGSTNLSGFATSFVQSGSGLTFTPATGVISGTSSAANQIRTSISGLSLGRHVVRITQNVNTIILYSDGMDVITPIHATKSNIAFDLQNTLPVGNQSIGDLRKLKRDVVKQKNIVQAFGVTSAPMTTSLTPIPMPDMSVVHTNASGKIKINYSAICLNSSTSTTNAQIYVDGVAIGQLKNMSGNNLSTVSDSIILNVGVGTHKVDIFWFVGGNTGTVTSRNLTVEEL